MDFSSAGRASFVAADVLFVAADGRGGVAGVKGFEGVIDPGAPRRSFTCRVTCLVTVEEHPDSSRRLRDIVTKIALAIARPGFKPKICDCAREESSHCLRRLVTQGLRAVTLPRVSLAS